VSEFDFPELSWTEVTLRLQDALAPPRTREAGEGEGIYERRSEQPPIESSERIMFGGPLATPLLSSDVDEADLATFMRDHDAAWLLVHSGVTFPGHHERFELTQAAVELGLGDADLKAWSMLPMSAGTGVELSSGFKLAPNLQIAGTGGGVGEFERGARRKGEEAFLLAEGLLSSKPSWRFKRTPAVKLEGTYRLVMVVRGVAGQRSQLTVRLTGAVRTGRFSGTTELHPAAPPGVELAFPNRS
jgi:hypothetical protein